MKKIEATDPVAHSTDIVADNITALKALFPDAFIEGKVDFEILRQLLGGATDDREEKYSLNWNGKRKARQLALTPSTGTLRPAPDESLDWATTNNLIIEGDNLEVLKLLQRSFAGTVKLIYLDPPYNTGKDFVYPDDFSNSIRNYLELTGQTEGGKKISSNVESSGRFHTDWLNMMYPRLKLASTLLAKDGALFVSCDDHEPHNLRHLLDEIMGEECFVAQIAVVNNLKGRNDRKHIATAHEYLLFYARPDFDSLGLPLSNKQLAEFKHSDESGLRFQWRDLRKRGGADTRTARPNLYFPVFADPATGKCSMEKTSTFSTEIYPQKSDGTDGCWRWGRAKVTAAVSHLQATSVGGKDRWNISYRIYLEEDGEERVAKPKSVWFGPELSTDAATKSLRSLLPEAADFTPKSVDLMKLIAYQALDDGDLCLDFFAGTGTLGQAVMELNAEDGANRRYILCQLPEQTGRGDYKTIADVTKERLRRTATRLRKDSPLLKADTGFRVFKLDSSNIRAWDPNRDDIATTLDQAVEHLKKDRSEQDILFELILKLGIDPAVPIETRKIGNRTTYSIGAGVLLACLAETIAGKDVETLALGLAEWHKALAPAGETQVVFRDSAFSDDVAKSNLLISQ